ncbi:PDZ domain-containing protein [Streptomyces sp. NPDC001941]|uniref:PDZ domain-containing protein n=1 Tax=Streptomyces sp. NPDC001941 TaxID=3154659 RepID=UPI00333066B0
MSISRRAAAVCAAGAAALALSLPAASPALAQEAPRTGAGASAQTVSRLGVETAPLTRLPGGGAVPGFVVSRVAPGGPSAKAGIVAGDRIARVDDVWVNDVNELDARLAALPAGTRVSLYVQHRSDPRMDVLYVTV